MPTIDKERERFLTRQAFRATILYPPERVKHTERKRGKKAAQRQRTAIALDQARRFGVNIPKR